MGLTFIFYSPNYRCMNDTENRGPGRPFKYGERLERVQVLVTSEQRSQAEAEAERRGVSVSEVYRTWFNAGRASDQKGKRK
jgi:hypothetical protein